MNFRRGLSSVWQTNQGLGTYGGHGYAATLPHTIITFLMSFFIPLKYIRSSFTFLTLFGGSLGVFFLLRKVIEKNENLKNFSSLLGAVFYLLNLATIQNFYIQLEAFIVHFAFLPWLFLTLINFLESKRKKDLISFCLVTFVSSIQGFIPPLFFVYLILLGFILLFYFLENISWVRIKEICLIFLVTIFVNAYWFFPVVFYSLSRGETYLNSYNNLQSTEDFIFKNQKYGTIKNVVLLKGFLLEAVDTNEGGNVFEIFYPWNRHLEESLVNFLSYLVFGLVVLGWFKCLKGLRGSKNYYFGAFLVGSLVIFSLLVTSQSPFSFLTGVIQKIPILRQGFRVAFTKFSLALAFLYAISFGLGCLVILEIFINHLKKIFLVFFMVVVFLAIEIYLALPVFQGNLIYGRTKLNIPKIYFELFEFLKSQKKDLRIANFPQGWHWGWSLYKWGYSGSGFLWYGIEQPIMDRAFDVWGKANENYYWEINRAIYSENFSQVETIFEKYNIGWIIFDQNLVPYPNVKGFLYSDKFEKYLESSSKFSLMRAFNSDDPKVSQIKLYRVNLDSSVIGFKGFGKIENIGPNYEYSDDDIVFEENGSYLTDSKTDFELFYPFRTLFSGRGPLRDPAINENGENLIFQSKSVFPGKDYISAESVKEKIYDSLDDPNFYNRQAIKCGPKFLSPKVIKQEVIDNSFVRFSSEGGENCYSINLESVSQRDGYLIAVESRNITGENLQFAVVNRDSKKADLEVRLTKSKEFSVDYLILPPMKYYGLGYDLVFNNASIGEIKTINDLQRIVIYKFPYDYLRRLKFSSLPGKDKSPQNVFVFYQSYDPGWLAFEKIGRFAFRKLDNHVLVNNWANGWEIDQSAINNQQLTIYLFFWPQILEYLGFFLLLITPIIIWIIPLDKRITT